MKKHRQLKSNRYIEKLKNLYFDNKYMEVYQKCYILGFYDSSIGVIHNCNDFYINRNKISLSEYIPRHFLTYMEKFYEKNNSRL